MSKATIELFDAPAGAVDMIVTYDGGFDPEQASHVAAELLIGKMAELAEPLGEPRHLSMQEAVQERLAREALAAETRGG